ncbi:sigma-w pathway protein ysdB [Peribacillus acanthi]|uniref:sigma-w pathway protein ysdB n=1 Tax=Peribacillus acanthi TaxID=2171554 RepID=UPI000D3EC952|nr:sigma-w pathway protein ysdB [Peribacillus acanthi]
MMWLFRLALLAIFVFIVYSAFKYLTSPKRKLELAHEQKKFFFLDDTANIRKNFLLTYKGVLFEGEKYLGTTEEAFDVISIFIWPKSTSALKGLDRSDFLYIESEVRKNYRNAAIDWKSPIKEFLNVKQP